MVMTANAPSPIGREIERRMRLLGMSQRELSLKVGKNPYYIRDLLDGTTTSPRAEKLKQVAQALGCTMADLTGEYRRRRTIPTAASMENDGARLSDRDGFIDYTKIQEIDVRAGAAGGGAIVAELMADGTSDWKDQIPVKGTWELPSDVARRVTDSAAEKMVIIRVTGNSMVPDFLPGDRVMVDTGDTVPSPPGAFIVWDGLNLVIKAVEYIPHSDPPTVRLSSANQQYAPYERALNEAYIQGRVIGKWLWT